MKNVLAKTASIFKGSTNTELKDKFKKYDFEMLNDIYKQTTGYKLNGKVLGGAY